MILREAHNEVKQVVLARNTRTVGRRMRKPVTWQQAAEAARRQLNLSKPKVTWKTPKPQQTSQPG